MVVCCAYHDGRAPLWANPRSETHRLVRCIRLQRRTSLKIVPTVDPSDYLMISLLAGLVTSPSAILGSYSPPPSAQELRRSATRDRRAILALVNALFSVIGVGVAVWRASSTAGWPDSTVRLLRPLLLLTPTFK